MTPAAVLDRRRSAAPLALWTGDDPSVASAPAPAAAPSDAAAPAAVATPADHGVERLADAVENAWSALEAGFTTTCLACGGSMRPRWSAGAGVVGGRCADCGTAVE